jgi:hypothetical protein
MLNLIEGTCVVAVIASVGAPLCYAVATLDGLQHKTMYPLFRFIRHNGRLSSTQTPSSQQSSHGIGLDAVPY